MIKDIDKKEALSGLTGISAGNVRTGVKQIRPKEIKKLVAFLLAALLLVSLTVCFCACGNSDSDKLLRLHIRANSNLAVDQSVKLLVRDSVVSYLEKELSDITSLSKAKSEIEKRKHIIKQIADKVLGQNGFNYTSSVSLNNEYFPTRMYDDIVLESGYYDALIIQLGSGQGDNWWCVIYPPLCYVDVEFGNDFRYKSKIKEFWDRYFG